MIDNAGVLRVNSEKLELSLYRSFSPTTDIQECVQNFISTLSEGLNADYVTLLIKSKSGDEVLYTLLNICSRAKRSVKR